MQRKGAILADPDTATLCSPPNLDNHIGKLPCTVHPQASHSLSEEASTMWLRREDAPQTLLPLDSVRTFC